MIQIIYCLFFAMLLFIGSTNDILLYYFYIYSNIVCVGGRFTARHDCSLIVDVFESVDHLVSRFGVIILSVANIIHFSRMFGFILLRIVQPLYCNYIEVYVACSQLYIVGIIISYKLYCCRSQQHSNKLNNYQTYSIVFVWGTQTYSIVFVCHHVV